MVRVIHIFALGKNLVASFVLIVSAGLENEDILEAMKEQQLDGYQDELRQYYESLVR